MFNTEDYNVQDKSLSRFSVSVTQQIRKRFLSLLLLFFASFVLYLLMSRVAPVLDGQIMPFLLVWGGCFLLYFLACFWVMRTMPFVGRGFWLELGLIFLGAVVFRVILLPLPLGLSRDAWRYLWDGHIMVHGFNPYLYTPLDKALLPIRDSLFLFTPWREIPSMYPPVAEIFFLVGYLLMHTQLLATKALFVLCDLGTCLSLIALLMLKKMDPRRVLIYAWCPLPIVEFAVEGHADAVVIVFTVLAILCAQNPWHGSRVYTGIFLGLATLAKLYPVLLLFALVRQRDYSLLTSYFLTLLVGFLPFMLTAHGHLFVPIRVFLGQQTLLISVLFDIIKMLGAHFHISLSLTRLIYTILEYAIAGVVILTIVIQRLHHRISVEAASLILILLAISLYSHLFPWYASALLPWIAILWEPCWKKGKLNARGLAVAACWYLTVAVILSYINAERPYATPQYWLIYYGVSFGIMLLGLSIAGVIHLVNRVHCGD